MKIMAEEKQNQEQQEEQEQPKTEGQKTQEELNQTANEEDLLEALKSRYGDEVEEKYKLASNNGQEDVYVYIFDDDDPYLFKLLKTKDYRRLNKQARQLAMNNNTDQEDELKDLIIQKFVVYPELDKDSIQEMSAGKSESVYNLIMAASDFNSQNPVLKI